MEGQRTLDESAMDGIERTEQVATRIFPKSNVSSVKHFNTGNEKTRLCFQSLVPASVWGELFGRSQEKIWGDLL